MIYILCKFGKIISLVTIDDDVIDIQSMGPLEKCGRVVFKIVSSMYDIETIKKGLL